MTKRIAALCLALSLAATLTGCAQRPPAATPPAAPAAAPTTATPNVVGMNRDAAAQALAASGLGVGPSKESYSDSVKTGVIISQSPGAGTAVAPGTGVGLEISAGPEGAPPAAKPKSGSGSPTGKSSSASGPAPSSSDAAIAAAFRNHQSDVRVTGQGTVTKVLADDTNGDRHQRFILRLASGQTLLIAHNIDIAPRVPSLAPGSTVAFAGVYEWNSQGGTVHWTHHDPSGDHPAGWLKCNGATYQ